ncbi:hypothetical protein L596_001236 [Steinernema carpocapsae]|uniref:Uncharacterized protein n=1 Tax=Steinernema carpocapsae TaxID=34508 RepID=A0A4U8UKP2_STECR|nr:hypothetical protein L596_001236 [Steinernema carpocapsae]
MDIRDILRTTMEQSLVMLGEFVDDRNTAFFNALSDGQQMIALYKEHLRDLERHYLNVVPHQRFCLERYTRRMFRYSLRNREILQQWSEDLDFLRHLLANSEDASEEELAQLCQGICTYGTTMRRQNRMESVPILRRIFDLTIHVMRHTLDLENEHLAAAQAAQQQA